MFGLVQWVKDYFYPEMMRYAEDMPRGKIRDSNSICPPNMGFFKGLELRLSSCGTDSILERTYLIDQHGVRYDKGLRADILDRMIQYQPQIMPAGHSHPDAAALRTGITKQMSNVIASLGYTRYDVSSGSRELDCDGCRYYYVPKDIALEMKDDIIDSNHIITMVDVDYYTNFNGYLSYGRPILLYTFVPNAVAGTIPDGTYTFLKDSILQTRVKGGAIYEHKLWDHSKETVVVPALNGGQFVYTVEQRQCKEDSTRRIILYLPVAWIPKQIQITEEPVTRLIVTHGDSTVLRVYGEVESISVGVTGMTVCATVPSAVYEACKIRLKEAKLPSLSAVERIMTASNQDNSLLASPLLYNHFQNCTQFEGGIIVATSNTPHYQGVKGSAYEDGKEYAAVAAPCLLENPAMCPTESRNNDEWCIKDRVNKIANNVVPKGLYNKYAKEFCHMLVPTVGVGAPLDFEGVWAKQKRPTQRARILQCLHQVFGNKFEVKAFQKRESYPNLKAPRNISQCPPDHTLTLSSYTYSFKEDVLSKQLWYGPGKDPRELAQRMQQIASMTDNIITTDYTKFDGSISKWLRVNVESQAYMRWCNNSHKKELRQLLQAEYNAKATTKQGVKYKPGHGRLSGSPLTTDGNTMINAFVSYATLRNAGYGPENAYKLLGMYCGDDGVNISNCMQIGETAKQLGLQAKVQPVGKGQPVPYCSRYYIDPWTSEGSFCDPYRALGKLHIVTQRQNIEQQLYDKVSGYLVTDSHTPLISDWCLRIKILLEKSGITEIKETTYRSAQGPYPTGSQSDVFNAFLAVTGLSASDYQTIKDRIELCDKIDNMPAGLIVNDFEISEPVIVEGQLMGPEKRVNGCTKASVQENKNETSSRQKGDETSANAESNERNSLGAATPRPESVNGGARRKNCAIRRGEDQCPEQRINSNNSGHCQSRFNDWSRNIKQHRDRAGRVVKWLGRKTNAVIRQIPDKFRHSRVHTRGALHVERSDSCLLGQQPVRRQTVSRPNIGNIRKYEPPREPCLTANEVPRSKDAAAKTTMVCNTGSRSASGTAYKSRTGNRGVNRDYRP
jgi:hypothetical protein